MISILAAVLYGFSGLAQDKISFGTDIMPVISSGHICICADHGFSQRWSAAFSAEMNVRPGRKERNREYEDHLAEFGGGTYDTNDLKGSYRLSVRYWMRETHEGVHLGIGCRCSKNEKPLCTADIGYSMPITRSFRLMLSYETALTASLKEDKPSGQGIRLGLRWIIKTTGK